MSDITNTEAQHPNACEAPLDAPTIAQEAARDVVSAAVRVITSCGNPDIGREFADILRPYAVMLATRYPMELQWPVLDRMNEETAKRMLAELLPLAHRALDAAARNAQVP